MHVRETYIVHVPPHTLTRAPIIAPYPLQYLCHHHPLLAKSAASPSYSLRFVDYMLRRKDQIGLVVIDDAEHNVTLQVLEGQIWLWRILGLKRSFGIKTTLWSGDEWYVQTRKYNSSFSLAAIRGVRAGMKMFIFVCSTCVARQHWRMQCSQAVPSPTYKMECTSATHVPMSVMRSLFFVVTNYDRNCDLSLDAN